VEAFRRFPADNGAPRAARHFIGDVLKQWGFSRKLLDDAQLVLSELATNAVIHARSPFSVLVRSDDSRLRLAVQDSSRVMPTCRFGLPKGMPGRGLHVVAALSSAWGVDATSDGKAVWAELRA
jgi:anti-sigma regulatory factor (Ser/Thr protein kinase)